MTTHNSQKTTIQLFPILLGNILDIGGGGDGIIGRLYPKQATVIDKYQEELEEAPISCPKLRMDATKLSFTDGSFQHITFFYSLMYMTAAEQAAALEEAARVCTKGGTICIWDCEIQSAYPEPFLVNLDVQLPLETVTTTYGIVKSDGQTKQSISVLCRNLNLENEQHEEGNGSFFLAFRKR